MAARLDTGSHIGITQKGKEFDAQEVPSAHNMDSREANPSLALHGIYLANITTLGDALKTVLVDASHHGDDRKEKGAHITCTARKPLDDEWVDIG